MSLSYLLVLVYVFRSGHRADSDGRFDDLLVLGKTLKDGQIDRDYRLRLDRAADLLQSNSGVRLILLGGQTDPSWVSEARAGSDYLLQLGVPEHAIELEEASRHTLENLRHAREMIENKGGKRIGLVTNRYHLARSKIIARGLNINVEPVAAEENPWPGPIMSLLSEAYLLHWYLTGRYLAHLTGDQASLDQIS
ncbi:MAG: YdcF family protein [Gammaproteobacteria bacterium]|nr:YdcF family protein [Gammaproteobacteria bacterium]